MKNGKTLKWLLTLACLLAALCAFTLAANAKSVEYDMVTLEDGTLRVDIYLIDCIGNSSGTIQFDHAGMIFNNYNNGKDARAQVRQKEIADHRIHAQIDSPGNHSAQRRRQQMSGADSEEEAEAQ